MRHLPSLIVLALAGCVVELNVPDSAQVACTSNSDCVPPDICKKSLGICVSSEGDDGRAPALLEVSLTPAVVSVDGQLELTFTADEPLGLPPEVALGSSGLFTLSAADSATQHYELRYVVRGTEPPGQLPVIATLVDEFGNAAEVVAATATLDFLAPRLGVAVWTLPGAKRAVKPGDTVTLLANVDADAALESAVLFADDLEIADVTDSFLVAVSPSDGSLQLRGELTRP
jgi:hypothetical protein